MSAAVRERPGARTGGGGLPARRAIVRWAWRLLRREWRQQLLILALIIVAVAATFVGSAVAVNTPPSAAAEFGTASGLVSLGPGPGLAAQVALLARRFGRTDVIEDETLPIPGSVLTYSLRAQNPHGAFGQPMLSLVSGHYPAGPGQVAVTSGLAAQFHLRTGGTWRVAGADRRVTGIVANPQDLVQQFALVAPGQVTAPSLVTVLFDAPAGALAGTALAGDEVSRAAAGNAGVLNPETISIAAATLGMLLIALVSVGGFTVLAQRRLRSIGMLGAQGATDASIGLVVRANGFVTGVTGAAGGFGLGLAAWLAYRPQAEASAHHVMGAFQLPWLVIFVSMALAVLAAYLAAVRPARAVARMPIVAALAGRPPAPRPTRRWAGLAGAGLLVLAFFLIGLASEQSTASDGQTSKSALILPLIAALVALCAGVVLAGPTCLALLARMSRRAPVVVRLALRDLARYRARSGAALGAISISVLIAAIVCVIVGARFGDVIDYTGPNLTASQMAVYPAAATAQPGAQPGKRASAGQSARAQKHHQQQAAPAGRITVLEHTLTGYVPSPVTAAQLAAMTAEARGIGAALGSRNVIRLDTTDSSLQRDAAGRNWNGAVYVATPQLLRAFGIPAAQVRPDAIILSMRPGLSTLTRMWLRYGGFKFGPPDSSGCRPASCLASPAIQEVSALPSGTSAPNTVITEHAVRTLHLSTAVVGWLIQAPGPLTAAQVSAAQHAAAAAGLTVETRNDIPTSAEITSAATVFAIALALGILAMSIGLLRSETASSRRTLTATGASGAARRAISAATAGALALTGAIIGTAGGYIAAIGFLRTNQLDTLSSLSSIPVASLVLILAGLPLAATAGGWLLAGREPGVIGRRPLE